MKTNTTSSTHPIVPPLKRQPPTKVVGPTLSPKTRPLPSNTAHRMQDTEMEMEQELPSDSTVIAITPIPSRPPPKPHDASLNAAGKKPAVEESAEALAVQRLKHRVHLLLSLLAQEAPDTLTPDQMDRLPSEMKVKPHAGLVQAKNASKDKPLRPDVDRDRTLSLESMLAAAHSDQRQATAEKPIKMKSGLPVPTSRNRRPKLVPIPGNVSKKNDLHEALHPLQQQAPFMKSQWMKPAQGSKKTTTASHERYQKVAMKGQKMSKRGSIDRNLDILTSRQRLPAPAQPQLTNQPYLHPPVPYGMFPPIEMQQRYDLPQQYMQQVQQPFMYGEGLYLQQLQQQQSMGQFDAQGIWQPFAQPYTYEQPMFYSN